MCPAPKISIITPCFNTGRLLYDLASSLESQTFKDFEWCIADDGSAEPTREILLDIKKSFDFSINVQFFDKRGGNYCRNRGFEASTAQFVKFVDADDVLEEDLLEEQYRVAQQHPESIVLSRTKIERPSKERFVVDLDPELKTAPLRSYLRRPTFMHGGCLMPRWLVEKVDKWDESLKAGQDLDFYRRILLENPAIEFSKSHFIYRNHHDAPRISKLSKSDNAKFEGHFAALEKFCEILVDRDLLGQYRQELAKNYDVWAMKAMALDIQIASSFQAKAKELSPSYRSSSLFTNVARSILGDYFTSKLIRSRAVKTLHLWLVRFRCWPKS